MKIFGIRSVDIQIKASGEGVVNHNGAYPVYNPAAGAVVNNHNMPKLSGMDPMQRISQNGENGQSLTLSLSDEVFANAGLLVSAECIRSHIFRDVSFGLYKVNMSNVDNVLASLHGLVRGYMITDGGRNFGRKSPLYVTDFECPTPKLTFNQGTNSKARGTEDEKTSMYSYFKTGKNLQYTAKATINIEELQFIPLENSLGRSAYDFQVTVENGKALAEKITQYLVDIADEGQAPEAVFVKKAIRKNSVSNVGDAGIILNDDALRIITGQVVELIKDLYIRQGKGYVQVTETVVDYNDSSVVYRAENDATLANSVPNGPFAKYYTPMDMTDVEFSQIQKESKAKQDVMAAEKLAKKTAKDLKKKEAADKKAEGNK